MKKLIVIVIVIILVIVAATFLYFKPGDLFQTKSDSSSLDFYGRSFEIDTLSLSVRLKKVNLDSITVIGTKNEIFDLPVESGFKIRKEKVINGKLEPEDIIAAQAENGSFKMTIISLHKDSTGIYRVFNINLFE